MELSELAREASDNGCEYLTMEVSSHALDQHRVDGIAFNMAVFTNLSQDHLDYHKSLDEYLTAKQRHWRRLKSIKPNLMSDSRRQKPPLTGTSRKRTVQPVWWACRKRFWSVWDFPTWPACFFEHRFAALIVTFAVGAGLFPESRLAEGLPTSASAQFRN